MAGSMLEFLVPSSTASRAQPRLSYHYCRLNQTHDLAFQFVMEKQIYTRVYSDSSAGAYKSRVGERDSPLSSLELQDSFEKHMNPKNRIPTALVSVSSPIVDTCLRAFQKHYEDKEAANTIWIAFIESPVRKDGIPVGAHSAQTLARRFKTGNPGACRYEIVFEWSIPQEYVKHRVSLATLMERGLDWSKYGVTPHYRLPKTEELREAMARDLVPSEPHLDFYEVGLSLGIDARCFGARAPSLWLAERLFCDCNRDGQLILESHEELTDGIDRALIEWWLTDSEFLGAYEGLQAEKEIIEEVKLDLHTSFWQEWGLDDVDPEGLAEYNDAKKKKQEKLAEIDKSIERDRTRIGL